MSMNFDTTDGFLRFLKKLQFLKNNFLGKKCRNLKDFTTAVRLQTSVS